MGRKIVFMLLAALGLVAVVLSVGLPPFDSKARALPTAGTDILNVTGSTSIISVLGSETIALTGTVTIQRSDPRIEGGVEVVDTEIVAMDLTGTSVTGPITVVESATLVSSGEIRSLQPLPDEYPASSFFDSFITVAIPGSPIDPQILHNKAPFHLVPTSGGIEVSLTAWPPTGVTYEDAPEPCIPLQPSLPAQVCVTSLAIVMGDSKSAPTPCPAGKVPTNGGCGTPTTTPTFMPTPMPPPNDDFADAEPVAALPFIDHENTTLATLESGEPQPCPLITNGQTIWYSFTPSTDVVLVADTMGSGYDTVLAAYTGTSLGTLSSVACNDDSPGMGLLSRVQFSAMGGVTYHFQLGGFFSSAGHADFNLSQIAPDATPTPTPTPKPPDGDTDGDTIVNSEDPDDDNDGCTDVQELGPSATLGGERNPHNFWDFYDVPAGTPLERDQMGNIIDIAAIVLRFGTVSSPPPTEEEAFAEALTLPPDVTSYHAAYDRGGPIPGQDLWDLRPPDGAINIIDIGAAVIQFGHTCS